MNSRQQLIEQIRQQSVQARAQALKEAAQRQFSNAPVAGAAASGGGRRPSCLPIGGVMATFIIPDPPYDNPLALLFAESGQEGGRPRYIAETIVLEPGLGSFGITITWDVAESKWYVKFIGGYDIARASDLFSNEWEMLTEIFPPLSTTTQGSNFLCEWRYCFTTQEVGLSLKSSPFANWFDGAPLSEFPNAFFTGDGGGIFWSDEDSSWIGDFGEFVLLGGTRDALPIGTFNISEELVFTIEAGYCDSQPPLPPLPPL
jgi:hypothetical protein